LDLGEAADIDVSSVTAPTHFGPQVRSHRSGYGTVEAEMGRRSRIAGASVVPHLRCLRVRVKEPQERSGTAEADKGPQVRPLDRRCGQGTLSEKPHLRWEYRRCRTADAILGPLVR